MAIWAGGPPKPVQPMRVHSRIIVRRETCSDGIGTTASSWPGSASGGDMGAGHRRSPANLGQRSLIAPSAGPVAPHALDRDHNHLSPFGTHPEHGGHTWGMELLACDLTRIDAEQVPAHLESTNPVNLGRYRSLGFNVRGEYPLPGEGLTVSTMWRDARRGNVRPRRVREACCMVPLSEAVAFVFPARPAVRLGPLHWLSVERTCGDQDVRVIDCRLAAGL
jgi:hypothetical protein